MISVSNGINTFRVTVGVFNNTFKNQGFYIVENKANDENKIPDNNENEKNNSDFDFEELKEKPVSQWTKKEIIAFAKENEIDISGTKNIAEARNIIKEFID